LKPLSRQVRKRQGESFSFDTESQDEVQDRRAG
jgi:hypothetical protein